jgi:glutathione S-transferase
MTMTLFYFPGACSLASHIALEELAEPYETVKVDVLAGEQHQPSYRAINPHGKVPALATEHGVLTETPAILTYLADRRPELGLLPSDPFTRAQALSTMVWLASSMHPAFARIWRGALLTDDASALPGIKAKAEASLRDHFAELDHRLTDAIWLLGDFSVVDAYILVMRRWGSRVGFDMAHYPALVAHGNRMAARPSVERVLTHEGIRIDG